MPTPDSPGPPSSNRSPAPELPRIETVRLGTEPPARPRSRRWRELIELLLIALVIFVAVRMVVLSYRVSGSSMLPNLENGQALLVNRNAYRSFDTWALVDWLPWVDHEDPNIVHLFSPPERGDIVVFHPPDREESTLVKRIVGLAGETVVLRDDGVYIDGVRLDEPYLDTTEMCSPQPTCGPFEVPEGQVFVMGDNRGNSRDSPDFGTVPVDHIVGKVWLRYWPLNQFGPVPQPSYPETDGEG